MSSSSSPLGVCLDVGDRGACAEVRGKDFADVLGRRGGGDDGGIEDLLSGGLSLGSGGDCTRGLAAEISLERGRGEVDCSEGMAGGLSRGGGGKADRMEPSMERGRGKFDCSEGTGEGLSLGKGGSGDDCLNESSRVKGRSGEECVGLSSGNDGPCGDSIKSSLDRGFFGEE